MMIIDHGRFRNQTARRLRSAPFFRPAAENVYAFKKYGAIPLIDNI